MGLCHGNDQCSHHSTKLLKIRSTFINEDPRSIIEIFKIINNLQLAEKAPKYTFSDLFI